MKLFSVAAALALSFLMLTITSYAQGHPSDTTTHKLPGKWIANVESNGNTVQLYYTFALKGDSLTGELQGPNGTVPLQNGTFRNSILSFDVFRMSGALHHSGKFYGDSLTLDLKPRDEAIHLVLKRE